MGILSLFKKQDKQETIDKEQRKKFFENVNFNTLPDGRLQVDYYNASLKFKQFYDTTRLIVSKKPIKIENQDVLNCLVSWYGESDAVMIDDDGNEFGRKTDYRDIFAQIDLNLLKTDDKYCYAVMQLLFDRNRVYRYLRQGLEENPDIPCGKYIGGIMKKDDRYTKFFDRRIGIASHYSNLMREKRMEYRRQERIKRGEQISKKVEQIIDLKDDIDNLSR